MKSRTEQIKEASQNEMMQYPNFCITAPAFRMGAEWADAHPRWVSVEEALPECDKPVSGLEDNIYMSEMCAVRLNNGLIRLATLNQNYDEGKASGDPYWFDEILTSDGCWLNQLVTHWFALPKVEERR